jgi:F-type H+-transporting ATPase subunit epsilon
MRVTLISPERSLYDGDASAVVAPAFDGQVGILPQHAPFLTVLGTGVVTITGNGGAARFQVSGGFLQVVGAQVRLVVAEAQTA